LSQKHGRIGEANREPKLEGGGGKATCWGQFRRKQRLGQMKG
jgi:hypothetical protein